MPDYRVRTRKERVELWKNSKPKDYKPEPHEREAWLEYWTAEDIRTKYEIKLDEARQEMSADQAKVALLREKIRNTKNQDEALALMREMKRVENTVLFDKRDVDTFEHLYTLLDKLCQVAEYYIKNEEYDKVVALIPEHKLAAYARKKDKYLVELVEKIYEEIRDVVAKIREQAAEHTAAIEKMDNTERVHDELLNNNRDKKLLEEIEAIQNEKPVTDDEVVYSAAVNNNNNNA